MQFEGRRRSSQIPNLTPLIDVVFLLLVFFMLTSHFVRDEAMNIDLPVADSGKSVENDRGVELHIDRDGRFLMQGHIVEPDSLEQTLRLALADSDKKTLRVRGDRRVALEQAVAVMDAAKRAGASGVDLVTESP